MRRVGLIFLNGQIGLVETKASLYFWFFDFKFIKIVSLSKVFVRFFSHHYFQLVRHFRGHSGVARKFSDGFLDRDQIFVKIVVNKLFLKRIMINSGEPHLKVSLALILNLIEVVDLVNFHVRLLFFCRMREYLF